jgi:hypothetical protein
MAAAAAAVEEEVNETRTKSSEQNDDRSIGLLAANRHL